MGGGGAAVSAGNIGIGQGALEQATGTGASLNVSIGPQSGNLLVTGDKNVFIGYAASSQGPNAPITETTAIGTTARTFGEHAVALGAYSKAGYRSVSVGTNAGGGGEAELSVYLGYGAGPYDVYNSAVNKDNTLWINNAISDTPLIYGEFDNGFVTINGDLNVTGSIDGYASTSYVDTAVGNVTIDLSTAAGTNLDWNSGTSQFDVNSAGLLSNPTISSGLTLDGTGDFTISADANIVLDATTEVYIGSVASGNEVATKSYADAAVAALVDSAPSTLNTLNELAAALGDDASYATTITTALGNKQDKVTDVSDTEIGYLNGVTSAIQTQLDDKSPLNNPTFTGFVTVPSIQITGSITDINLSEGAAGQVLSSNGTRVEWVTPAGGAAFSELMLIGA